MLNPDWNYYTNGFGVLLFFYENYMPEGCIWRAMLYLAKLRKPLLHSRIHIQTNLERSLNACTFAVLCFGLLATIYRFCLASFCRVHWSFTFYVDLFSIFRVYQLGAWFVHFLKPYFSVSINTWTHSPAVQGRLLIKNSSTAIKLIEQLFLLLYMIWMTGLGAVYLFFGLFPLILHLNKCTKMKKIKPVCVKYLLICTNKPRKDFVVLLVFDPRPIKYHWFTSNKSKGLQEFVRLFFNLVRETILQVCKLLIVL